MAEKKIRPQLDIWNHVTISFTTAAKTSDNKDGREEGSYICSYEITLNHCDI